MKFLKQLFDFYINASIHVAFAVVAFCVITTEQHNLMYDLEFLSFIFFASISGYNFVKYFGLAKFHHRSLTGWLKTIQVFSLICFLAMCYFGMVLQRQSLIFLAALGLVTFLYAVPFLPRHVFMDHQKNLRSVSGLKVFVIALVWTAVTVLLPFLEDERSIDFGVLISALRRFIVVIVLMLPFEIRDLQYDSLRLATIPQQIGIKATKILGVFLSLVVMTLALIFNSSDERLWTVFLMASLLIISVLSARKGRGSYFCSFFVESIPILWMILVLLA